MGTNRSQVKINFLFFGFLAALLVSGCTGSQKPAKGVLQNLGGDEIFSNRPQNINQSIVVLKLPTPPLFATMQIKDGVRELNKVQAEQIEKEQNLLILELKKMSNEVQVLFRYRLLLNAITVVVPNQLRPAISQLPGIMASEKGQSFTRPEVNAENTSPGEARGSLNSVNFIGAESAYARGVKGQGMKVGVLDTGIDYTHGMLGGVGTEEAYKSVDPNKENSFFPNQKIVGGIDLVGTKYNAASDIFSERIPQPDLNPLDEAGHGTHVAGTIGGIGDGENTYSGVAPESQIYAIKVFGAKGSTSDEVVIAGLEWAADPNRDLDLKDQLDVVNLSLGSQYGTPHIMYSEAVENLSKGGTVVVASAGNEGPNMHIVGAPSITEEAFSIAASVDGMEHNWKFDAVKFVTSTQASIVVEAIEGNASKKISEAGDVKGDLIYVGTANEDFSPEMLEKIKGKVALIDRGVKTFIEKLTRVAKAGAVGAVVVNNQDGEPMAMGMAGADDKAVEIPAIMITKALGSTLKEELAQNKLAQIEFKTETRIEKPELIDTITGFSSQGPRSEDALIKPEIAAPGQSILSAEMGKGKKGIKMSGTSMSGPHMAGVMSLLKQAHPELNSRELKALAMGSAKTILDKDKKVYPVSRMGAGRVQVDKALSMRLISSSPSVSLGNVRIEKQKTLRKSFSLKNISSEALALKMKFVGSEILSTPEQSIALEAGESKSVAVSIKVTPAGLKDKPLEASGILIFLQGETEVYRIPVLAMVAPVSQLKAKELSVHATSALESAGSAVDLKLKNTSAQAGTALIFNPLGVDGRKEDSSRNPLKSHACDLQAAGYRVINGKLQIGVKLFESLTTWDTCEISVLIDTNGDNLADQELVGMPLSHLGGLAAGSEFMTLLLDANKAREIRKKYEESLTPENKKPEAPDYKPALLSVDQMKVFNLSTLGVIQVELGALGLRPTGEMALKLATISGEDYNVEQDDFLGSSEEWKKLDLSPKGQSFSEMPEVVSLSSQGEETVALEKGEGSEDLMIFYPQNKAVMGVQIGDEQMEIVKPSFQ